MTSIQDLLIPRWRIQIHFPGCPFEVGEVMKGTYYQIDGLYKYYYEEYPDCFLKLRWWQERDPSELPKYIKFDRYVEGKYTEVVREVCSPHEHIPAFGENYVSFFDDEGKIVMEEMRDIRKFLPATEKEFLQFKRNKYENS